MILVNIFLLKINDLIKNINKLTIFLVTHSIQEPHITVVKENTLRKNEIDPNTLPYLHRNPAI